MPVLTVELTVRMNGQPLPGFPFVKRIQTTEAQVIATQKAGGDGAGIYVVVPGADVIPAVQGFALQSDQAVLIRLNGQTNGSIALNAGGILILLDGNLNAGALTNLTINNAGVPAANLNGFTAGT